MEIKKNNRCDHASTLNKYDKMYTKMYTNQSLFKLLNKPEKVKLPS